MAKTLHSLFPLLFFSSLFLTHPRLTTTSKRHRFAEFPTQHLHFYFHDTVSGPNPTAIRIAATNSSSTSFGTLVMIDNLLTAGPSPRSKPVGRAQGMYDFASQTEFALLMATTLAFTDGEYKGSSLSVVGRNVVAEEVREMPVVGGSGVFRMARGYVEAKTYSFNLTSGNAVLEYDVYVFH